MNKLAIVGTHPETRAAAPFDDPSYDIWVFNEAPQDCPGSNPKHPELEWCKRWDVDFQMHKPEVYMSSNNMVNKTHWEWLQKQHPGKVIYMQDYDEFVPNSRRFPMEEIRATLAPAAFGWFTSTVTMALALGLYLGYERIEVWGVDLSSNTEYAYQQPCWLYWCGAAKAMLGENFVLHCGLHHFNHRLYGYEGEPQIDRAYFAERAEYWEQEYRTLEHVAKKAKERLDKAIIDREFDKVSEMLPGMQENVIAAAEAAGALQEARAYAMRDDPIARQQFERRGATGNGEAQQKQTAMDKESGKVEYVWNAWRMTQNPEAQKQLRQFISNLIAYAVELGGNMGVAHENFRYMGEYDARVTAAGGARTLKALGVE